MAVRLREMEQQLAPAETEAAEAPEAEAAAAAAAAQLVEAEAETCPSPRKRRRPEPQAQLPVRQGPVQAHQWPGWPQALQQQHPASQDQSLPSASTQSPQGQGQTATSSTEHGTLSYASSTALLGEMSLDLLPSGQPVEEDQLTAAPRATPASRSGSSAGREGAETQGGAATSAAAADPREARVAGALSAVAASPTTEIQPVAAPRGKSASVRSDESLLVEGGLPGSSSSSSSGVNVPPRCPTEDSGPASTSPLTGAAGKAAKAPAGPAGLPVVSPTRPPQVPAPVPVTSDTVAPATAAAPATAVAIAAAPAPAAAAAAPAPAPGQPFTPPPHTPAKAESGGDRPPPAAPLTQSVVGFSTPAQQVQGQPQARQGAISSLTAAVRAQWEQQPLPPPQLPLSSPPALARAGSGSAPARVGSGPPPLLPQWDGVDAGTMLQLRRQLQQQEQETKALLAHIASLEAGRWVDRSSLGPALEPLRWLPVLLFFARPRFRPWRLPWGVGAGLCRRPCRCPRSASVPQAN